MWVKNVLTAADLPSRLDQTRQSVQSQRPYCSERGRIIWVMIVQPKKDNLKLRNLIKYDQCASSRETLREVKTDGRKRLEGLRERWYQPSDWDAEQQGRTSREAGWCVIDWHADRARTDSTSALRTSIQSVLTNVPSCLRRGGCV